MAQINPSLPVVGLSDSTEDPKIVTALSQILALVNGGLDEANLAATLLDKLGATGGGTTRRGFTLVATSETTASTTFVDLATVGPSATVTVPTNGLVLCVASADEGTTTGGTLAASIQVVRGAVSLGTFSQTNGPALATMTSTVFVDVPAAGAQTYKLQYKSSSGAATQTFANRKLWVVAMSFA